MTKDPQPDGHEDDAFCEGDPPDDVLLSDPSLVDLQSEYDRVNAIQDPVERLAEARKLVARLGERDG